VLADGFLVSMRSIERTLIFRRPFRLSAVDDVLPSGRYRIITEQEPLEGLSFTAWQRVRTLLFLPADSLPGKARQVVPVDPNELEAALAADALESPQDA
jgi:hypothetical protein